MAKLSDFLGGLVSGISDARVNSDIQSLRIAQDYAKNDLLKHFSVPRMRVDKVELSIPVAIDKLLERKETVYMLADIKKFSEKAFQYILKPFGVSSLSGEISQQLMEHIAEQVSILESAIKTNPVDGALETFSKNIALKVAGLGSAIFKEIKRKKLTASELAKLQTSVATELLALKADIKIKSETKVLDSLQVIVEADRLREVKPENVIMIKMTVSEQGMEWIKMEDSKGEVVTRLMPE